MSELDRALAELRFELRQLGDRFLLPVLRWGDGQLARWPWLYRRLGGNQ